MNLSSIYPDASQITFFTLLLDIVFSTYLPPANPLKKYTLANKNVLHNHWNH